MVHYLNGTLADTGAMLTACHFVSCIALRDVKVECAFVKIKE